MMPKKEGGGGKPAVYFKLAPLNPRAKLVFGALEQSEKQKKAPETPENYFVL